MTPRILIIAGSDSGGGAGIQADIKTVTMLGGFAMTAITALTAQNTLGVSGVLPVPTDFVMAQVEAVLSDLDRLEALAPIPVVFDPVMVASSGSVLADDATIAAFERLMGVSTLVTPNAPELAALIGRPVRTVDAAEEGARMLAARSGAAILAKGGHLPGDGITDLLVTPGGEVVRWESERLETRNSHGTGCTLASAIAAGLGAGMGLADAIGRARAYVRATLGAAPGFGAGHGPMAHALGVDPFAVIASKAPSA